ncbi:hypothetical protein ACOMHN_035350 [Nucella lapillus]
MVSSQPLATTAATTAHNCRYNCSYNCRYNCRFNCLDNCRYNCRYRYNCRCRDFLGTAVGGNGDYLPYNNAGGSTVGQSNSGSPFFGRRDHQQGYGQGNGGYGLNTPRYGAPSVSNPYQTLPHLGNFPSQAPSLPRSNPAGTYGKGVPYGNQNPYPQKSYNIPTNKPHSVGKTHSNPYQGRDANSQSKFYQKKAPNGYSNGGYKSQSSFQFQKQPETCHGCSKLHPKLNGLSGKAFPSFASPFGKGGLFGNNGFFNALSSSPSKTGLGSGLSLNRKPYVESQHTSQDASYAQRQNLPHNGQASVKGFPSSSGLKNPAFPQPGPYQQNSGQNYNSYQNPFFSQENFKLDNSPFTSKTRPVQFSPSGSNFPPVKSAQTYPSSNGQSFGLPHVYRNKELTGAVGDQRVATAQNTNDKFSDGDKYRKNNAFSISGGNAAAGRGGWDNKKQFSDSTGDRNVYSDRRRAGGQDGYKTRYDNRADYDTRQPHSANGAYGPASHNNAGYSSYPTNQNNRFARRG